MVTRIGKQIRQAAADGRINQREVESLLETALKNGKVSATERRELTALLTTQTSRFTAGAKATLERFLAPPTPVPPVAPPPAGTRPAQLELPASTNPYYPNDCPWYAVQTGRTGTDGQPAFAFFSKGMIITNRPTVAHGGTDYRQDAGLFRLGAGARTPGNSVPVVQAGASRAGLPAWAKNGDVSLVHEPENRAFLDALLTQLGPELARRVRAEAPWHPGLERVTPADLRNVKVTYVAQYGQEEGKSGNGRRIALSFEVQTSRGLVKLTSDLSDTFYTDPLRGGRYGFQDAAGNFLGHQPVDNVMVVG